MSSIVSQYFTEDMQRFWYLLHSSERFRYAYIETPKVACSTIKYYLQLLEYDGDRTRMFRNVHNRAKSPLVPVNELGYTESNMCNVLLGYDWLKFTFVRNPYTRVLSAYMDKIVQRDKKLRTTERFRELGFPPDAEISFERFLHAVRTLSPDNMDIHWAPQAHLTGVINNFKYDFIGRFEHFDADFARVLERLGAPADWYQAIENRQQTVTKAKEKLIEYYTPEAIELVQQIYAADFDRFGYGYSLDLA